MEILDPKIIEMQVRDTCVSVLFVCTVNAITTSIPIKNYEIRLIVEKNVRITKPYIFLL